MTTITCAISGLKLAVPHCDGLKLSYAAGYYHPIFVANNTQLHSLYNSYVKNELLPTDSYLLFLAFAHSSGLIEWRHPLCVPNPADPLVTKHIANYMARLITVLSKSATIKHPEFNQPACRITKDSNALPNLLSYIKTWESNIDDFLLYRKELAQAERLNHVANKLAAHIKSAAGLPTYTKVIADWAHTAAIFPPDKVDSYKAIITSCCNKQTMFNTPLALIKEVKEYCEEHIEVGSIHYHTLNKALSLAVRNHIDYLGVSYATTSYSLSASTASDSGSGYENTAKTRAVLEEAIKGASLTEPNAADYPNKLDFIKAKLAFRLAKSAPTVPTAPAAASFTIAPIDSESQANDI